MFAALMPPSARVPLCPELDVSPAHTDKKLAPAAQTHQSGDSREKTRRNKKCSARLECFSR